MSGARRPLLLGLLLASAACTRGPSFQAAQQSTSTVAVGTTRTLVVESVLASLIQAHPNQQDIEVTLSIVVTASSAATAERLAKGYGPSVTRYEGGGLRIRIPALPEAGLDGQAALSIPSFLELQVNQESGPTEIRGARAKLEVQGGSSVVITDAERDIRVRAPAANLDVDSALLGSTTVDLGVQSGSIVLRVPQALNAEIEALVESNGQVRPAHPRLRPEIVGPGQLYRVTVGGGGNIVRMVTGTGSIVIQER